MTAFLPPRIPPGTRVGPDRLVTRLLFSSPGAELHELSRLGPKRNLLLVAYPPAGGQSAWIAGLTQPSEAVETTDVTGAVASLIEAGRAFRLSTASGWSVAAEVGPSAMPQIDLVLDAVLDAVALAHAEGVRPLWLPRLMLVRSSEMTFTCEPLLGSRRADLAGLDLVSDFVGAVYGLLLGTDVDPTGRLPLLEEWVPGCPATLAARLAELSQNVRDRRIDPDPGVARSQVVSLLFGAGTGAPTPEGAPGASPGPEQIAQKARGLAAVAGMHRLKDLLLREVVLPLKEPGKYREYGLGLPNGILLFGPPGCGKTYIARRLAEELGQPFIEVLPSGVGSPFIHETSLRINTVFKDAARRAPAVVFFDEFESLAPHREGMSSHLQHKAEEVNELLSHLSDAADAGILVIAASNEPERIDPAVRRSGRMDKLIYVGPPDGPARIEILRFHLGRRPGAEQVDVPRVADELEGYSASDIRLLVDEAARRALDMSVDIAEFHLFDAASRVPPSISTASEKRYLEFGSRGM